ncbi:hypothetical protein SLEP1_g58092 [Rubroshorea leprosula]|uniref:Uncharacterized protein n=1 Tax=Rubroshorea leprosula TaxID=152421 RepID=A0AAV5MQL6_9ROSI|nr:hypothetical protein SLEP1_g58092 [Rubroshorea leprosula]
MHGMSVGFGIGPSFGAHQPVIFNLTVAPMQSPQAYFNPNGAQYGQQQMFLGKSGQVVCMPSYQPEFKLNPNAKGFTPSQTTVRPPSPVSDGSFY